MKQEQWGQFVIGVKEASDQENLNHSANYYLLSALAKVGGLADAVRERKGGKSALNYALGALMVDLVNYALVSGQQVAYQGIKESIDTDLSEQELLGFITCDTGFLIAGDVINVENTIAAVWRLAALYRISVKSYCEFAQMNLAAAAAKDNN